METFVPVLGPEGWVSDPKKKLDTILAHMYCSDFSQTFFFSDEVSSMAHVVKEYQGRLGESAEAVKRMLENYLAKYFQEINVHVYVVENNSILRGELALAGVCTDPETGAVLELHEVMTRQGNVVREVLDYQYEGVL